MNKENKIIIHFYKGAYGPTIGIDVSAENSLQMFKDIVKDLSIGKLTEFKLSDAPFVKCDGLKNFILKIVPKSKWSSKTVFISKRNGIISFEWSNSTDGWLTSLELLEGMSGETPGHQYLSIEKIDDALIEVSFREYPQKEEGFSGHDT